MATRMSAPWMLPNGWEWRPLESVADILMGQSPPGSTYNDRGDGLPFFQGKAQFGDLYPVANTWCTAPTRIAQPGDVLVSVRAPVGPTNLSKDICCIGRGLAAIRPNKGAVSERYLLYGMRALESRLSALGQGSTFAAIGKQLLRTFELPIPLPGDAVRSLAEQGRIVARVEVLLAEVSEARKLHRRIVADTGRVMEACIAEAFDREDDSWAVAPLAAQAFIQTGTAKGRRFGTRQTVSVPYLRVANVQAGFLDLGEIKEIRIAEGEVERYRLRKGDLLLTEGGDYDKLGRGAIWRGELDLCVHQNHIFAVRFDPSRVLPEFAEYEMQSNYAKTYFLGVAKKTTNLATINKTQLGAFPLKYLNMAEQHRIVARLGEVQSQMQAMRELQARDGALLEHLEQSILAQAFRGEL